MTILDGGGGGTNMAKVTLRCTKDGTNYDYAGTDTQPSSGKYLKYTNGSKTGYLYLNSVDKGYIATLSSNNKKLRVNDYYVEEYNGSSTSIPIYYFVGSRYTTWASESSSYADGYINMVRPKMITGIVHNNPVAVSVVNAGPLVNLYHPATNSFPMDVIFNMPYGGTTTKSFNINCRKESPNGMISSDSYYTPTTYQAYRSSNVYYSCYYGEYNSSTYPSLYHRGIFFVRRTCSAYYYNWYRTAEG